jgi:hypothetical protein
MKIFKELKKLGYIHYSATTIEELDDLPLNSAERVSEQALVLRWFREKYNINTVVECWNSEWKFTIQLINHCSNGNTEDCFLTYEEAELECLVKLIDIVKKQNLKN